MVHFFQCSKSPLSQKHALYTRIKKKYISMDIWTTEQIDKKILQDMLALIGACFWFFLLLLFQYPIVNNTWIEINTKNRMLLFYRLRLEWRGTNYMKFPVFLSSSHFDIGYIFLFDHLKHYNEISVWHDNEVWGRFYHLLHSTRQTRDVGLAMDVDFIVGRYFERIRGGGGDHI